MRGALLGVLGACSLLACGQDAGEQLGESPSALLSGTALFVANTTVLSSADNQLRNRLETMGLQVVVKSAASAVSADANGKALVVISSTVSPASVNTKFRTVAVPVLTWESELYDDLGMTPTTAGNFGTQSGQKSLSITAGHPLAAGLSGTQLVFNEPNTPSLTTSFNWGKPNANAARVATIPSDSTRFAVFGYLAGASMPGLVAPARRVGFFAGDTSATSFTANGWALFEAAVNFSLGTSSPPPPPTDTDGDRLPDSVETNTGVFVSATNTGSNPNNADSDGDGINDGDEVLGTTAGLNLPALGTSPVHKNVLLEYDWFQDSLDCASHSHRPTAAATATVAAAFANAPVSNPDGTTGIKLIQDYGQGGVFTGGNFISDADGVLVGTVFDTEYQNYKTANFATARSGYFHYVLLPHRYDTNSDSSGYAEIVGDDLIVSLYCANSDTNVANTIMHELGHNLGLQHGGADSTNYKPNYNSVMNYLYQFPGVDTNCTPPGDGLLDYSRNRRNTLDETALQESIGICNNVPWDWNGNGSIDAGTVHTDINLDAFESTLTDFDDWANLVYRWQSSAFGRSVQRAVACDNPAPLP
jgi:gametolysin peptidase M11